MKNHSQIVLFAIFLLALLFNLSCKHNPVGPPPPPANDTTSHVFTFQQFTWGGGGSSYLQDVAILSDTNIWCVGEIQLNEQDSLGFNYPYGAVHWNGTSWTLVKLPTNIGLTYTQYLTPTGIVAFAPNDFWFANAGGVHRFNGSAITQSYWLANFPGNTGIFTSGQIVQKVWGTSDNNLYAIATKGGIAHFDGSNWQKLSSPTQLDIMDIYGATDPRTGQLEILALATQVDSMPSQSQLLRIQGTTVSPVATFSKVYFSLWFVPEEKYYLVGDGIISTNSSVNPTWNNVSVGATTQYEAATIRGAALNDIFVTGSNLDVVHYNGSTWFDYVNQIPSSSLGGYPGVALRGNTMVAVGFNDQDAILLIGKR